MNPFAKIRAAISGGRGHLETIRAKISGLKAERDQVAHAPLAEAEAFEQLDRMIANAANGFERAKANFGYLVRSGGDLELIFGPPALNIGAVAWLMPDLLRERLVTELRRQWQATPAGLPAAERRAKLVAIDAEIVRLERGEEQLILAAEAEGVDLERRADLSPEVFLEVEAADDRPAA